MTSRSSKWQQLVRAVRSCICTIPITHNIMHALNTYQVRSRHRNSNVAEAMPAGILEATLRGHWLLGKGLKGYHRHQHQTTVTYGHMCVVLGTVDLSQSTCVTQLRDEQQ